MGTTRSPHKGGIQFWPRKRARRMFARVRSYAHSESAKLLGFAGYKAGMLHIAITDNWPNSMTKGEEIVIPATVIECPPIRVFSLRFYKKIPSGSAVSFETISKVDKDLARALNPTKKEGKPIEEFEKRLDQVSDITAIICTEPRLTGIGKKKPEVFEIAIGGKSVQEKFNAGKQMLGKEISIREVFKEGQLIDVHAVSRGHGLQGPVKRFGIGLRSHKSEKTIRGPGTLGPWHPHMVSIKVAHAGQMGMHQRTEYNKWILKISDKAERINPKSGFMHYGIVKNTYVILKGSVPGTQGRLIRLNEPIRKPKHLPEQPPEIQQIIA